MIPTSATAAPLGITRSLAAAPLWVKTAAVLVGSAIVALSAQITVPMIPVPMTMQTYAILIVGALYGSRLGFITLMAYLAEGAMGLPVFAGGNGSLAYILSSSTTGFLIGFPAMAFVAGWFMERGWSASLVKSAIGLTIAHLVVFAFGVPYLAAGLGWEKAIAVGFAPFILGTVVKTALAVATVEAAVRVKR